MVEASFEPEDQFPSLYGTFKNSLVKHKEISCSEI